MSLQGITATWANTPKQQNNVQLTVIARGSCLLLTLIATDFHQKRSGISKVSQF